MAEVPSARVDGAHLAEVHRVVEDDRIDVAGRARLAVVLVRRLGTPEHYVVRSAGEDRPRVRRDEEPGHDHDDIGPELVAGGQQSLVGDLDGVVPLERLDPLAAPLDVGTGVEVETIVEVERCDLDAVGVQMDGMNVGDRVPNQFEEMWTVIEIFDEGQTVVLERDGETRVLPRRLVERP